MGFNFEKLNELSNDRSKEVMRKAGRIIRDRHSRIPDKYKKIDTAVNGDAESLPNNTRKWKEGYSLYALTRPLLFTSQKTNKMKHMQRRHVNGWG